MQCPAWYHFLGETSNIAAWRNGIVHSQRVDGVLETTVECNDSFQLSHGGCAVACFEFDVNDPNARKELRELLGPDAVGRYVRNAVGLCWMLMPEEQRSQSAVESEIRRELDIALKELQGHAAANTATRRESEVRTLAQQYVHGIYGVVPSVVSVKQCTKATLIATMAKLGDESNDDESATKMVQILHGAPDDSNWWMIFFHAFREVNQPHHQTAVQLLIEDSSAEIHEFKQVYEVPLEALSPEEGPGPK
jgi:hypothetical protein